MDLLENEDTQKNRYLTFSIGNEEYGIEIKYVTEIIKLPEITEIPDVPYYVKGIINIRGRVLSVVDIRLRFDKEPKEYHDRTSVVVINVNGNSVGFIVDEVSEVINIGEENIVQPPDMNGSTNGFIKLIGKVENSVKLIIDCEKLIES